MVTIVRIVGVAALILAGLVLALLWGPFHPFGLGAPDNQGAKDFLSAPSAVETFNKSRVAGASASGDKTSPLVKQALALEEVMRPRVEVAQASSNRGGPTPPSPVKPVVKFNLIGISYSASDPHASFAFIRLPDNTYQWIQPGSVVGHQTVKEIKGGSIVCTDGQRDSEISVEATPNTASLLETGAATPVAAASGLPSPAVRPATFPGGRPPVPDPASAAAKPAPVDSGRLSEQEKARVDELANRLKERLQKSPGSGQPDSNTAAQDQAAVDKLISEFKSSRVSAGEAQKLDNLGEQLNGATEKRAAEKNRELLRRLNQKRAPQQ
jgi:hypothetical protein